MTAVSIREFKDHINRTYFKRNLTDFDEWRSQFPNYLTSTVVNIPARSGSTRVKDKNIHNICGLPLLAYTILVARQLEGVDRIIVNTDSPRYAEIARHYGAEVPFLRPAELASDTVKPFWSQYYLFRFLMEEDYPVKTVVTLAPTNLFRNIETMQGWLDKTKKHGRVQTCLAVENNIHRIHKRCGKDAMKTPIANSSEYANGQQLYKNLGNFYGSHIANEDIESSRSYFVTDPIELIDIDYPEDLLVAEAIIQSKAYDFGFSL